MFLLSGCAAKTPDPSASLDAIDPNGSPVESSLPTPTLTDGFEPNPSTPRVELANCTEAPIAMELPASSVQPSLPDGFIATGLLGDTFASVNLNILTCETVVLENTASLQNVGLAFTMVQVDVGNEWQNGSTDQAYAFEVFATDPALADYFRTHGIDAMDAEISLTFGPQTMEASIRVAGSEWYQVQGSRAEYPPTSDIQIDRRMFQAADAGTPWLQYNETYRVFTFLDGAQVTASDGVLKTFTPGQEGTLAGVTQRDESAGIITFGFFAKS